MCRHNDGRVRVGAHRVEFFASIFVLEDHANQRTIARGADDTLRLDGFVQEEGTEGTTPAKTVLKLVLSNRLRIDRTNHVYIRCPS